MRLPGTKFKIVFGYPGGADVNIAMERGEVGGRGSNLWASWKSTRPQWLAEKKIHMLVQIALKRHPELPDVPLMQELVKYELHKQVMTFISADTGIARSIVTAPDVPAERVALLRQAFDAAMKDPALIKEAEQAQQDISPTSGVDAQEVANSSSTRRRKSSPAPSRSWVAASSAHCLVSRLVIRRWSCSANRKQGHLAIRACYRSGSLAIAAMR